jgi:MiaB/RimO family radical SAM methylthiotransferase
MAPRPIKELVAEADKLAQAGAIELTLVAQDLTAWRDDKGHDLGDLAKALAKTPIEWLRLMYAHPLGISEKLILKLANNRKVVPYLDMPLQHSSPSILRAMGRPVTDPLALIEKIRSWWPLVALRTTVMVGFPGETPADFEKLMDFVKAARFDNLGVFQYEPEEPAPATLLPGRVPKAIQRKRRELVMLAQKKISLSINAERLNQYYDVLVEGPSPDNPYVMIGRTKFQAPEVDGLVYFDGEQPKTGTLVEAFAVNVAAYDMVVQIQAR